MKFVRWHWCDEAAEALNGLISAEMMPIMLGWIEKGSAILWRICGADYVTWLITRVEMYPNGTRELVLEVIAGKNCRAIVKALIDRAKTLGIHSIRFETHHSEKLATKFLGGLGFKRAATILRAEI